jgi:hypothetical protein
LKLADVLFFLKGDDTPSFTLVENGKMAHRKDHANDAPSSDELDSASGVWRRSPAPSQSRALHDARNLVFALKATLVWLDELCVGENASVEVREGIEDLSAVAERLNGLLTEALSSESGHAARRGTQE